MELKDIIIGSGEYGIPASSIDYQEGYPIYLRITDITDDGFFMPNPKVSFDYRNYDYEKYKLQESDIVFARTGNSTGRNYLYNKDDGDLYYAGFLIKYKLDKSKVIPDFIRFYCKSYQYWNWIRNVSKDGSTRKKMNAQDYLKMPIPEVPMPRQQEIVDKLIPLEDKIKSNWRLINYLVEYSQLLFHKWFIDFNFPNEKGLPYKDNGGEMIKVDGKMLPKGWKIDSINTFGEIVSGGTPSTAHEEYFTDNGIPWITPKDLSQKNTMYIKKGEIDITKLGLKNSSAKIMPKGTVLMSSRAPIGYLTIARNDVTTNQGFKSIVPRKSEFSEFIYFTLKSKMKQIHSISSGSTFREISKEMMNKLKVVVPPDDKIVEYYCLNKSIFEKIALLENEQELLRESRDLLIKKLIK